MATSVVSQPTQATGDTIEAAYSNTNRDSVVVLDVRTGGDPGGAGKILVSSGPLGAAWLAIGANGLPLVSNGTTLIYVQLGAAGLAAGAAAANIGAGGVSAAMLAAGAALSNLGYTPVNKAGDTGIGTLTHASGQQINFASENANKIDLSSTGTYVIAVAASTLKLVTAQFVEFWNSAAGGASFRYDTSAHTLLINGGLAWHSNNDGAGSGLDADKVDGFEAANLVKNSPASNQTILGNGGTQISIGNAGPVYGTVGLEVIGDIKASGSKNRMATGHDQNIGTFHSLETPLPMFEEVGRAQLVDGVATVPIPRDFANYVALDDYYLFLTPEGPSHLYVAEQTPESFTIRAYPGEPDITFSWRLMARQGDLLYIERNLPVGGVQAVREDGQ